MAKKNIVLCSDGTGNTILKGRGTNVFKLYESVDLGLHRKIMSGGEEAEDGIFEQIAFYDDGVGTSGFKPLKLLGGAFGLGLKRNVLDLYMALCRVYQPGDQIYLFGFSRGAYTVRMLAGLIIACGVIHRDRWSDIPELTSISKKAYRAFRHYFPLMGSEISKENDENPKRSKADAETKAFRDEYSIGQEEGTIKFIGIWDTVAAMGLPFKGLTTIWNKVFRFYFPDYVLSERVEKGCHALAIDDERLTFHPLLWDEDKEPEDSTRIEQVWFPGAHSNIGGGYPKQGLSLVTLDWMMQKAEESGLQFVESERERYRSQQNCHDWHYNSRKGLGVYYRYKPRGIQQIADAYNTRQPKIHVSTLERIASATQGYAPILLPEKFKVVNYHSILDARERKKIAAVVEPITASALEGDMEKWILYRRFSYYLFLTLTLFCVGFAFWFERSGIATEPSALSGFFGKLYDWLGAWAEVNPSIGGKALFVLKPFFFCLPYALGVLSFLGLTGIITLIARKRIHTKASQFWREKIKYPWSTQLAMLDEQSGSNSTDRPIV